MVRIYKHYNFSYQTANNVAVSFSSTPGFLSSVDDFYITSANLVILETTNGFYNMSLNSYLSNQTVMSWMRCMVATYLAADTVTWVDLFVDYNSGTYNNQWMVVDLKLFNQSTTDPLPNNTLAIIEQVPGPFSESGDVTFMLNERSYWDSYNIPYFPSVYAITGFQSMFNLFGNAYSYSSCPRANIFRRDAPGIETFDDFKRVMSWNNYLTDPFSLGDPSNAVMARGDLPLAPHASKQTREHRMWLNRVREFTTSRMRMGGNGIGYLQHSARAATGGIDSKVTSYNRALQFTSEARNGPTRSISLPAFTWNSTWNPTTPHLGQPMTFNFNYEIMKPTLAAIDYEVESIQSNTVATVAFAPQIVAPTSTPTPNQVRITEKQQKHVLRTIVA